MENFFKNRNFLLVIAMVFFILGVLRITGDIVNSNRPSQNKTTQDSGNSAWNILLNNRRWQRPCFNGECLDLKPKKENHRYNPYIANIGKPDNYNTWEMNRRYCFKDMLGKETACLDIYEEFGRRSVDMVAIEGYYCNTSNNRQNYECHINGSQVPDIQYDKKGQPTAYVCTPKGTYEDSTGDCKELAIGKFCKTALCKHDPFSDTWLPAGNEVQQWMFNYARCQWMRYNKTDYLDKKCSSTYNIP